ncbi:MAG: class I SAM-dependent methyltransferase [Frankiales bacterium]|nr:class I SAM-dependent methyltransferase [Frankiales bacterium]
MTDAWRCPVCGGENGTPRWRVTSTAVEDGVDARAFRPSADRFGETVERVLACAACGHGSLASRPSPEALAAAYADAADPETVAEEPGRLATADRGLAWVESVTGVGRLVDIGCWTGSLVAAAKDRGWEAIGIEPSTWAVERARSRGLDVRLGDLDSLDLDPGAWQCVAMCDVLEHLLDPAAAVATAVDLLAPGGALYVTVPDAGSRLARTMGARWWSVLPMHVQYFTRSSMSRMLSDAGLRVIGARSHPKVFTAGYYAGRLGGYSAGLARAAEGAVRRLGLAERPVAPDFRDRMQVLAVRPR